MRQVYLLQQLKDEFLESFFASYSNIYLILSSIIQIVFKSNALSSIYLLKKYKEQIQTILSLLLFSHQKSPTDINNNKLVGIFIIMTMNKSILLVATLLIFTTSIFDITHYGAVPNSDTITDQFKNAKAILDAIKAANASITSERIVRIPDKKFYSMPIRVENVHNITISVVGKLIASKNVKDWPRQEAMPTYYEDFLSFWSCTYIQIQGGGKIDGRGYHWWMLLFLNYKKLLPNQNSRPHLIHIVNCNFTSIHDLVLKNSAQFHLKMDHCHDGQLFNIDIKVNTTAQINLIKRFSLQGSFIMFPFNTDGIDPSGARFHIYNITCQNYDDVVVPKPEGARDCTRDFLVQNCTVFLGVGMTVGSVPPQRDCNCVKNITFRNVRMVRPFKGIYIKTNPGDQGTGLIQDIYYGNFTMDRPIWWAIYIGPQQMKQPDGDGPGCMLYPFDKKGTCSTQPRVTLQNITLQNIKIHKSLLYPYTIRCNVSNPCRDINFYNVQTDTWQIGQKQNGYVCQYVIGKTSNTYPNLHCLQQAGQPSTQVPQSERKNTIFDDFFQRTLTGFKISRMLFQQLQKATHEVGYHEQDDDFDYELPTETIEQAQ